MTNSLTAKLNSAALAFAISATLLWTAAAPVEPKSASFIATDYAQGPSMLGIYHLSEIGQ